ncbi:hypothetical protein D3C86_2091830 [compost metagenome]
MDAFVEVSEAVADVEDVRMATFVCRDWRGAIGDFALQCVGDFQKYRGLVSNRASCRETRQRGLNAALTSAV